MKELQQELEHAHLSPDITHIGLQTSPLVTPKMFPQGSQTSPAKTSSSRHRFSHSKLVEVANRSETNLHSELMSAGTNLSDPYDDPVIENGNSLSTDDSEISLTKPVDITGLTASTTSLTESDQQLANTRLINEQHSKLQLDSNNVRVEPVLYIASDDYDPQIMSPNPDQETELPLKKGEYVYVYGEQGDDGFHIGRLVDGSRGLVPSNYIKKLGDHICKLVHVWHMFEMVVYVQTHSAEEVGVVNINLYDFLDHWVTCYECV